MPLRNTMHRYHLSNNNNNKHPSPFNMNNEMEDPTLNMIFHMRELEGSLKQIEERKRLRHSIKFYATKPASHYQTLLIGPLNILWREGTIPKK